MYNYWIKADERLRNPFSRLRFPPENNEQMRVLNVRSKRSASTSRQLRNCFSEARPGFSLRPEKVEQMLDDLERTEGNPEVVQFSRLRADDSSANH
jgi:hypothetical protein